MRLSPIALMLWVAVFAAVLASFALLHARRPALPPMDDPSWLPLPATGMDASQPALRRLLLSRHGGHSDLAGDCGMRDDGSERERYRLTISRDAWRDIREIAIVPRGEWLEIEIRDGLPPPPPESGRASVVVAPVARARLHRRDAEPIRRAWNTRALWHAEQQPLGCRDGRPITLQACLGGRYAIRHRNCDIAAYRDTETLWEAVTTLLPSPEPARVRTP